MAGSKDFGNDLREARQRAELTQVGLAIKLGVDPGAISGWERGIRMPDEHNRAAVAAFMGLTIADYLVRYEAHDGSTGRQDGPTSPRKREAGSRSQRIAERAEEGQRLSEQELRLLRRLIERLEGTG